VAADVIAAEGSPFARWNKAIATGSFPRRGAPHPRAGRIPDRRPSFDFISLL